MKLIKKHMTLEEYERKYPKYQSRLLSFSDKEIKEFNDKFYKNNGNKQIPDKYALLSKYKWVHIKDRYYQVPNTGAKVGIAAGGAVVIAAAIALPLLLLNGVTVTASEFNDALSYLSSKNEDRRFAIDNGVYTIKADDPEMKESYDMSFKSEVEGFDEKTTIIQDSGGTKRESYTVTKTIDKETFIYKQDDESDPKSEYHWRSYSSSEPLFSDFVTCAYKTYAECFANFRKTGLNSYSCSGISVPSIISVLYPQFKDLRGMSTVTISFNKDKTIKSVNESIDFDPTTPSNEKLGKFNLSGSYSFKNIKTHSIASFPKFDKDKDPDKTFNLVSDGNTFSYYKAYLKEGEEYTFTFTPYKDEEFGIIVSGKYFNLEYEDGNFTEYITLDKDKNKISVAFGENKETFTLSKDKKYIIFDNTPDIDTKVTVKLTLDKSYDISCVRASASAPSFPGIALEYDSETSNKYVAFCSGINEGENKFGVLLDDTHSLKSFRIEESGETNSPIEISDVTAYWDDETEIEGSLKDGVFTFNTPVATTETDRYIVIKCSLPNSYEEIVAYGEVGA